MSGKRTLAALFAAGRLAFGLGLLARPERVASGWLGTDTERPTLGIALVAAMDR